MPLSLHAATVPSMLQILGAGKGWLAKARACEMEEGDVIKSCLAEDMLPFTYQVKSMAVHSKGAFEGVRNGVFSPDMSEPPATFDALDERLDDAIAYLEALSEEEVEALRGGDMRFQFGERQIPFSVDDFLLSFSQPNFYFHATTAYGILRANGVDLGKRDYMGRLRIKG
jgi:hypothetical protein